MIPIQLAHAALPLSDKEAKESHRGTDPLLLRTKCRWSDAKDGFTGGNKPFLDAIRQAIFRFFWQPVGESRECVIEPRAVGSGNALGLSRANSAGFTVVSIPGKFPRTKRLPHCKTLAERFVSEPTLPSGNQGRKGGFATFEKQHSIAC